MSGTEQIGKIIPRHEWPEGAEPDGRLYSLEVSRNSKLLEANGKPVLDDEGKFQFVPARKLEEFESEEIDYPRKTGTYVEIAAEAFRLNKAQQTSGFADWTFCPEPIEPMGAR